MKRSRAANRTRSRGRFGMLMAGCYTLLSGAPVGSDPSAQTPAAPTFTLDLRGMPVQTALRYLFVSARKNDSIDSNVGGTVTVACSGVTFEQALADVASAASPPLTTTVETQPFGNRSFSTYHVSQRTDALHPNPAETGAATSADIVSHDATVPPSLLSKNATHLTEDQATQAARAFCLKLGQPVTGAGHAVFAPSYDHLIGHYWLPRWSVIFPEQAVVQVADAGGAIAGYGDLSSRRDDASDAASGHFTLKMILPRDEALRRAKAALEATGQPDGALFRVIGMSDPGHWNADWRRAFRGIPYADRPDLNRDHVSVTMNTWSGRVQEILFDYPSPPVTRCVLTLSRDKAIHIARKDLPAGLPHADADVFPEAALGIMPPISPAQTSLPPTAPAPAPASRPVWIVRFHFGSPLDAPLQEIRVDAETGEIVQNRRLAPVGHFGPPNVPPPLK